MHTLHLHRRLDGELVVVTDGWWRDAGTTMVRCLDAAFTADVCERVQPEVVDKLTELDGAKNPSPAQAMFVKWARDASTICEIGPGPGSSTALFLLASDTARVLHFTTQAAADMSVERIRTLIGSTNADRLEVYSGAFNSTLPAAAAKHFRCDLLFVDELLQGHEVVAAAELAKQILLHAQSEVVHHTGGKADDVFNTADGWWTNECVAEDQRGNSGVETTEYCRTSHNIQPVIHSGKELITKHGLVFLQVLNYAFLDMTKSWICNVRKFGVLDKTLFITTDGASYQALKSLDPSLHVVLVHYKASLQMEFGNSAYICFYTYVPPSRVHPTCG